MPRILSLCFSIIIAVNVKSISSEPSPTDELVADSKAAYKSREIEMGPPMTLATIKNKLKDSGVFDESEYVLTEREKKELKRLFKAVEIMTLSRSRQPYNVQHAFTSLRLVERALKKQLKEGQISENLAAKFDWSRLINYDKDRIMS